VGPDLNDCYVENPEAIGDPTQTPRLFVGERLRALFNPCPKCRGVNGYHSDDCSSAGGPDGN
jgi:hypothetical protein